VAGSVSGFCASAKMAGLMLLVDYSGRKPLAACQNIDDQSPANREEVREVKESEEVKEVDEAVLGIPYTPNIPIPQLLPLRGMTETDGID